MSVRVRFAPSPTGFLHVGALRTALYDELFAKNKGGTNILRIEDTDRTRYNPESEAEFIKSLGWVGIQFDEGPHVGGKFGPYRQSERKEAGMYEPFIKELLEKGCAYKAFDTPEELDEMRLTQQINKQPTGYFGGAWRDASPAQVDQALADGKPYVIRLRVRKNRKIVLEDAIRGRIEWDSNTVDDPVLIKADGMPTYHFAAIVDDHLMEISHVFRGEEWISSAPKHLELSEQLGWTSPQYVHCPVIVGKNGKKLSKRDGAMRVLDYASQGYMPDPLKNFIALIGWSPGDNREELSPEELVKAFDIKGLQPSPGRFDIDKLNWLNGNSIRSLSLNELVGKVREYLDRPETFAFWEAFVGEEGTPDAQIDGKRVAMLLGLLKSKLAQDERYVTASLALEQERVHKLSDFAEACSLFVEETPTMDAKAVEKWLRADYVSAMFEHFIKAIEGLGEPTGEEYESILRGYQTEAGLEKLGPVVHPTRVALTGRTFGPGLWELMEVLGKKEVLARLGVWVTQKA